VREIEQKYRDVAVVIVASASDAERAALMTWSRELLAIRNGTDSSWNKAKAALKLTANSKVIWPVVRSLARELKRVGWDERGTKSRFAMVGAGAGVLLFGGQSAGIAALGTAIAVPLWVVLGARGAFIAVLMDEVEKEKTFRGASESKDL